MRCTNCCFALLAAAVLAFSSGCGDTPKPDKPGKTNGKGGDKTSGHPAHGPHNGHLIELGGDHEYHGEIVHDDTAGTVTIYILDGTAKKAAPIDAKEITINVTHDKKPEQFKLAASPDQGDPEGKSSRFVSKDKHLLEDLDAKGAQAELVFSVGSKQFRGKIEHEHKD
jgi:hypothetical protein